MVSNTYAIAAAAPSDNSTTIDNSTTRHGSLEVKDESESNVTDIVPLSTSLEPVDSMSSEGIKEVYEQVDASFEAGLTEITEAVFIEVVFHTYAFEEVILEAAREVGVQPNLRSRMHP